MGVSSKVLKENRRERKENAGHIKFFFNLFPILFNEIYQNDEKG